MSRKDLLILIATVLVVVAVAGAIFMIGRSQSAQESEAPAQEADQHPGIVLTSDDAEIESYKFPKEVLSASGLVSVESDASTSFVIPLEINSGNGEKATGIRVNSSTMPCWLEIKAKNDEGVRNLILRFSDDEENIIIQMIPAESIDLEKSDLGAKMGK